MVYRDYLGLCVVGFHFFFQMLSFFDFEDIGGFSVLSYWRFFCFVFLSNLCCLSDLQCIGLFFSISCVSFLFFTSRVLKVSLFGQYPLAIFGATGLHAAVSACRSFVLRLVCC